MDGWPPWRAADAKGAARAWVIAELGVNHDGDPRKLLRLVQAAGEAGADAIKLQLFEPGRLLSRSAELAGYQEGKADDAAALLAGLVMPPEENAKAVAMA
ncbi:MAG: N-acetylneuraminate synthase family protein, partial [Planctomycetota bacterium]